MIELINTIVLFIILLLAVFLDLTKKRIPNSITFPAIVWSFFINSILYGLNGFKFSVIGFLFGLVVLLIPFILGGMGGGDVKLMAAIGAMKGWRFVLYTAVYSGLAGGIIVVFILIRQKKFLVTLKRVLAILLKPIIFILTLTFENKKLKQFNDWLLDSQINWEKQYIPYGVAIGIGAIMALLI